MLIVQVCLVFDLSLLLEAVELIVL